MKHISLDEFRTHVAHMHADRDRWFESEYNVSMYWRCMLCALYHYVALI